MSEKKKLRLKEYQKNYHEAKNSQYNNQKCLLCSLVIQYLC